MTGTDGHPPTGEQTRRDDTSRDVAARPATARDGGLRPGSRPRHGIVLPDDLDQIYEVVDDLSTGGEATVAVVRHRDTAKMKVVKIYRQGISLPQDLVPKLAEADACHVLPVHRSIYTGWATPRFVELMDFLADGSLENLLHDSGEGVPQLARAILVEMTDALDYIHSRLGLVHRDVKPANVLIRAREPLDLVLADLGIASELDEIRRSRRETSGGVKGTLMYQAPETLNASDAGRPRDWWALGMMMCEVLTGSHPFKDSAGNPLRDEGRIRTAITLGEIDFSIVRNERWNRLCRGLLVHQPADRWGASQVRAWLAGEDPPIASTRPMAGTDRAVPGFRFAGQRFSSAVDLARHMVTHWDAAFELVSSKEECDALRIWIREDLRDMSIETNLLTATGGDRELVDARVLAFTTHYLGSRDVTFRGMRITAEQLALRYLEAGAAWEGDGALSALRPKVMEALIESQYTEGADQKGQSADYHALTRLSRYAADVDRTIDAAAARIVQSVAPRSAAGAGYSFSRSVQRSFTPRPPDRYAQPPRSFMPLDFEGPVPHVPVWQQPDGSYALSQSPSLTDFGVGGPALPPLFNELMGESPAAAAADIGVEIRDAMPRRIKRARAVGRAALLSQTCLSDIAVEFGQLDKGRPQWFADLCARIDAVPASQADPATIARMVFAVEVADFATRHDEARAEAEVAAERQRRQHAIEQRRSEIRDSLRLALFRAGIFGFLWLFLCYFIWGTANMKLPGAEGGLIEYFAAGSYTVTTWTAVLTVVGLTVVDLALGRGRDVVFGFGAVAGFALSCVYSFSRPDVGHPLDISLFWLTGAFGAVSYLVSAWYLRRHPDRRRS